MNIPEVYGTTSMFICLDILNPSIFSVQCLVYSKFKLLYTVKVSGDGLTTALSVTNLNGMQAQLMY